MNFKQLIKDNQKHVQRIIKLFTNENNEDIEQEVYTKVWKNADKYQEKGNFKTWICTIAKNMSMDYLKSSGYKQSKNSLCNDEALLSIKDKESTPENNLLKKIRQEKIVRAINNLKPKFKEIILLCEINDFSYEQASEKLKVPIGTVKS